MAWAISSTCPKYSPYILYAVYLFCSDSEFTRCKRALNIESERETIRLEIKKIVTKGYFTGGHPYSGPAGQ